jgi:transglutaminase-like putative cysteine protease
MSNRQTGSHLLGPQMIRLLACMVLLAQLPMMFHVPLWLSLPSMLIVLCRIARIDSAIISNPVVTGSLTLAGAIAIFASYGHVLQRDPCIAFLFMLTGFKLAETRYRNDATLLVILCALLLLTQFFYWQTIVAAVLTLPGIVLIGLCLFQLQRHPMDWDRTAAINITAKLFLQGLPVALLLFLAVPRLNPAGWGAASSATTGLSDKMSIGSVSEVVKSPEVALRVEYDGAIPAPEQRYWRGPVLSGFDGSNWFALPASYTRNRTGSEVAGVAPSEAATRYTVTISPSYQRWLPVLDTPLSAPRLLGNPSTNPVSVNRERVADAPRRVTRNVQYTAQSALTERFRPAYPPGPEYLITTASNPRTREFAAQLRAQTRDDALLIERLMQWYNQQAYHYTLSPRAISPDNAIDDFMFGTREGFCEHYASSFVFILRAAGIPARVVTGYLGGEQNGDYMIVRQSDAHAWAEAYLNGEWVRFDPTAAVAPERVNQGIDSVADVSAGLLGQLLPKSVSLKWDELNYAWQRLVIDFDRSSQSVLWRWLGIEQVRGWMIVAALLSMLLIPLGLLYGLDKLRMRARQSPVERQWRLFCERMERQGFKRQTGESATAYIARVGAAWPAQQPDLQRLLALYHQGRFSEAGVEDSAAIARSMRTTRRALRSVRAV